MRDHFGIIQIVVDPATPAFKVIEKVRSEWVIRVDGEVCARSDEAINTSLPTGEIEIFAKEVEILSKSDELPYPFLVNLIIQKIFD